MTRQTDVPLALAKSGSAGELALSGYRARQAQPVQGEPWTASSPRRVEHTGPSGCRTVYASGTKIATLDGYVEVENLSVGHPLFGCPHHAIRIDATAWRAGWGMSTDLLPVRIAKGALAADCPSRDLILHPDQSVLLRGILIPAKLLVNGSTITREPIANVSCFRLSLSARTLLDTEGVLTTSWLGSDDCPIFFIGDQVYLNAGYAGRESDIAAASLAGPILHEVRHQIAQRAAGVFGTDLWLDAAGKIMKAVRRGARYNFLIRAPIEDLHLVATASIVGDTPRSISEVECRLGVQIKRITVRGAEEERDIPVDHRALSRGFRKAKAQDGCLRCWTTGTSRLPVCLFQGLGPFILLTVELA